MITRLARCACGALRARIEGDPARNSVCHCLECKRRTGSAFSWNATFLADQVQIEGDSSVFVRPSDEGRWGRMNFCPECGVTVWYEIEARPGMVSIPVGAFTDVDFPPPEVEVYDERRCAWLPDFGVPRQF